jgi:hypothetical protein
MLKAELMAPAAADGLMQDQLAAKQAVAADAATALQQAVAALGPGLLDSYVLSDVAVEDLQQYLGLVNPPWSNVTSNESAAESAAAWDLPDKAQRRLGCIARIVAAVSFNRTVATNVLNDSPARNHVNVVAGMTEHISRQCLWLLHGWLKTVQHSCRQPASHVLTLEGVSVCYVAVITADALLGCLRCKAIECAQNESAQLCACTLVFSSVSCRLQQQELLAVQQHAR